MDIAEEVMTSEEYYDFLNSVTTDEREDVFTRMWTAKESIMKISGLGFRLPPKTFRVLYGYDLGCPYDDLVLHELDPPAGYHVTVCSSESDYICHESSVEELLSASTIADLL